MRAQQMWRRSGREILTAASVASPLQRAGSGSLHPLRLSGPGVLFQDHRQRAPVQQPFSDALRCLLRLGLPFSAGDANRLWCRGCSSSSGVSPNGGEEAEGGGQPTTAVATCWNCGRPSSKTSGPFLACGACGSVQPVDSSVDYFQIFGLEKEYKVRSGDVESKYKDWQKKLHPDLVHTKSERERSYAAEQSARVIDAYRTISRPLSRAIYLLKLEGLHVDEEKTISDPELLAEVMEIRETVEEADNSRALEQIKSELQEKLQSWSDSFGEAFRDRKLEDAVTSTQRMTYYERAIEEIVKKL